MVLATGAWLDQNDPEAVSKSEQVWVQNLPPRAPTYLEVNLPMGLWPRKAPGQLVTPGFPGWLV